MNMNLYVIFMGKLGSSGCFKIKAELKKVSGYCENLGRGTQDYWGI